MEEDLEEVLDVDHREDLARNRQEVLPAVVEGLKDLAEEVQEDTNIYFLIKNEIKRKTPSAFV